MKKTKPTNKPGRVERLRVYVEMMQAEESKAGNRTLSADLKALLAVLAVAAPALERAGNVPEWGNHEDDRTGKPNPLGEVACTYAAWIEEASEPASEHDGALQLAEMAQALRPLINALDRLHFDVNGVPR